MPKVSVYTTGTREWVGDRLEPIEPELLACHLYEAAPRVGEHVRITRGKVSVELEVLRVVHSPSKVSAFVDRNAAAVLRLRGAKDGEGPDDGAGGPDREG